MLANIFAQINNTHTQKLKFPALNDDEKQLFDNFFTKLYASSEYIITEQETVVELSDYDFLMIQASKVSKIDKLLTKLLLARSQRIGTINKLLSNKE